VRPVIKIGNDEFIFPIGDGNGSGKIGITNINSANASDRFTGEYFFSQSASLKKPLNGGIE